MSKKTIIKQNDRLGVGRKCLSLSTAISTARVEPIGDRLKTNNVQTKRQGERNMVCT